MVMENTPVEVYLISILLLFFLLQKNLYFISFITESKKMQSLTFYDISTFISHLNSTYIL